MTDFFVPTQDELKESASKYKKTILSNFFGNSSSQQTTTPKTTTPQKTQSVITNIGSQAKKTVNILIPTQEEIQAEYKKQTPQPSTVGNLAGSFSPQKQNVKPFINTIITPVEEHSKYENPTLSYWKGTLNTPSALTDFFTKTTEVENKIKNSAHLSDTAKQDLLKGVINYVNQQNPEIMKAMMEESFAIAPGEIVGSQLSKPAQQVLKGIVNRWGKNLTPDVLKREISNIKIPEIKSQFIELFNDISRKYTVKTPEVKNFTPIEIPQTVESGYTPAELETISKNKFKDNLQQDLNQKKLPAPGQTVRRPGEAIPMPGEVKNVNPNNIEYFAKKTEQPNILGNQPKKIQLLKTKEEALNFYNKELKGTIKDVVGNEIEFGDNDALSAAVAILIKADLLIILSDINGMYTADPRKDTGARLIDEVFDFDEITESYISGTASAFGTGGMVSKILAAKNCMEHEIEVVITNGEDPSNIFRVLNGEKIGTLFVSKGPGVISV